MNDPKLHRTSGLSSLCREYSGITNDLGVSVIQIELREPVTDGETGGNKGKRQVKIKIYK